MELILHHYPDSSFSEKVRLVLGYKQLAWRSVAIPAYGPKPDYTPLTAGYRRTPALQVGADMYCDTRLIVAELERRAPQPALYPAAPQARAQVEILVAWAEAQFFRPLALYISGLHAARFPAAFHADRAALHGKPLPTLAQVMAAAQHYLAQVEPQLAWLENLLAAEQDFVLGASVSLADFALYEGPWFLQRIGGTSPLLASLPRTRAWMQRVADIGRGEPCVLAARDALAIAAANAPLPWAASDYRAPEGVHLGDEVMVAPFDQHAPARGVLAYIDADRITLTHHATALGEVAVHFPRLGYRVSRVRP